MHTIKKTVVGVILSCFNRFNKVGRLKVEGQRPKVDEGDELSVLEEWLGLNNEAGELKKQGKKRLLLLVFLFGLGTIILVF